MITASYGHKQQSKLSFSGIGVHESLQGTALGGIIEDVLRETRNRKILRAIRKTDEAGLNILIGEENGAFFLEKHYSCQTSKPARCPFDTGNKLFRLMFIQCLKWKHDTHLYFTNILKNATHEFTGSTRELATLP